MGFRFGQAIFILVSGVRSFTFSKSTDSGSFLCFLCASEIKLSVSSEISTEEGGRLGSLPVAECTVNTHNALLIFCPQLIELMSGT